MVANWLYIVMAELTTTNHSGQNTLKRLNFPLCSDLQTVTDRLHSGYYSCVRLFRADMLRVFSNCRQFNERGSDYYRCAAALEKFFLSKMAEAGLEQAESLSSK